MAAGFKGIVSMVEAVQKDVKKWVDSVVEFKASLDKKKSEPPLENHLKKIKKFKVKKKSSLGEMPVAGSKNPNAAQLKRAKPKKVSKASPKGEKLFNKESVASTEKFDRIKEACGSVKLPPSWTSGFSNGRIVFNRIKVTTHNSQQKMSVEKSLIITKDCTTHVLFNGSEIILSNWEMQKVETIEDVKKAIKDVDALKVCEGSAAGSKSPHCLVFDTHEKICQACKSETTGTEATNPAPKILEGKTQGGPKKSAGTKQKEGASLKKATHQKA